MLLWLLLLYLILSLEFPTPLTVSETKPSTGKRQILNCKNKFNVLYRGKKKLLSVYIFYLPPTVHTNMYACKYNFGQNFLYTVPWLNRACNPYSRITLGYHEVFEKLLFFKYFLDAAVEFDQFLLQIARILSITFVPPFLQYGSNDAINYKEMKHCLVFIRP